jgi:GNAT superfamily N-acetyltransferase
VKGYFDAAHPLGTVLDGPVDTTGMFEIAAADLDDEGRPIIWVSAVATGHATPLWFVHLSDRDDPRPNATLVAFTGDQLPEGTVVSDARFFHLPVPNADQVGAIRWWTDEALIDQVYVADSWRRQHLATVLLYSASAFHQFNGWPGWLHADGRRTLNGEYLVLGFRHPNGFAPLEQLTASMDEPIGTPPPDRLPRSLWRRSRGD